MQTGIKINGKNFEVRVQERRVIDATVLRKGRIVARNHAVLNPEDEFDPEIGAKIALGRAFKKSGLDAKPIIKEIISKLKKKNAARFLGEVLNRLGLTGFHWSPNYPSPAWRHDAGFHKIEKSPSLSPLVSPLPSLESVLQETETPGLADPQWF